MLAILLVTTFFGLYKLMPVLLRTGPATGDLIEAMLFDRNLSCETELGKLEAFLGNAAFSVGLAGILEADGTRAGGLSFERVVRAGVSVTTGTFSSVGSS